MKRSKRAEPFCQSAGQRFSKFSITAVTEIRDVRWLRLPGCVTRVSQFPFPPLRGEPPISARAWQAGACASSRPRRPLTRCSRARAARAAPPPVLPCPFRLFGSEPGQGVHGLRVQTRARCRWLGNSLVTQCWGQGCAASLPAASRSWPVCMLARNGRKAPNGGWGEARERSADTLLTRFGASYGHWPSSATTAL